jgi:hypothetical protein
MRAALVAVAILATGCTSTPGAPEPEPTPIVIGPGAVVDPEGVHLTFIQTRSLEGTNWAQVRMINGSDQDIEVSEVGLEWSGFPGEVQDFPYLVGAGLTLDLPYDLPDPDCAADPTEPAYALVLAPQMHLRQEIDPAGRRFLDRLWRTACEEQAIAAAAEFGYGDRWRVTGRGEDSVLHGTLVVTRATNQEPLRVAQVKGSVLFALELSGLTTLEAGASLAAIPLDITRGRCDEHGRSQSTQTFVWRVWLQIGSAPPISHIVTPTPPQQDRLLAFLDEACAGHVE